MTTFNLETHIRVPKDAETELAAVLETCFPDTFDGRTFFKQEPHHRIVARKGSQIVGQVGLDLRVINVAGTLIKTVGVIDLCVLPQYRKQGIGTALLSKLETAVPDRQFSLAFADTPDLYVKSGYRRNATAQVRFTAIDDLQTHSIMENDLSDIFFLKPLGDTRWPNGKIDLLGYLF